MTTYFPQKWAALKVILSHDWLTGMRGGERVLELLCQGFPKAPVYTLFHNSGSVSEKIASHPILTSWIQRLPLRRHLYRYYLPLFPWAIESFHIPAGDLLVSTSHCVAKGLKPRGRTRHLCYCFTPMRYAWIFYDEYFGGSTLKKWMLKPLLNFLQRWDLRTSEQVDCFVAISKHVRDRIKKFYGREADVVYPPVNTEYFTPEKAEHADFDLIVSALVPYKRIDLAVRAYTQGGYPLNIVGVGTESSALKKLAGSNIRFLGWKSDEDIRNLYRACRCLIFPGEEDFGLVPLEAMACGRPVVAFGRGGALETVIPGITGIHFEHQTEKDLLAAVNECANQQWDSTVIRRQAERFGIQPFLQGMDQAIQKCLESAKPAPIRRDRGND